MSQHESVTIPGATNPGPSLQESYEALKAEGLISDEADVASTVTPEVAQGGAQGAEGDDTVGEDTDTERPSWLPEEFATEEEFREWYAAQKAGDDDEESTDEASAEVTDEERAAAEEATKKAGLDLSKVSDEYWANDGLSEETYKKLADAGYPQELVDVYIEGLVSRNSATERSVYELVGSQAVYGEMVQFALDNMDAEQQAAYDREINSGNKTRVLNAVKALKADFEAHRKANDSVEPESVIEAKGGAPKADTYAHLDDYMADLSDPRYATSETFRQKVMAKLSRSNVM